MVAHFSVYCAICSCPIGNSCEVGSNNPRHLKIRRARVARRTYSRRTGDLYYETDEETESDREQRIRKFPWLQETAEADADEDTASISSLDYDHGYDPDVISPEDFSWLADVFALGIAHRKPGPRTYMLCECSYDDGNRIYIDNAPNPDFSDEQSHYFAYGVPDLPDPPVFPVHGECIKLLNRAMFGIIDIDRIHKNILYEVMLDSTDFCRLNLGYGDITGPDQDWQCVPGEEYSVVCPTLQFDLEDRIIVDFEASLSESQTTIDLGNKVIKDPFNNTSYDVIHLILEFLSGDSIMALSSASWTIFTCTRNNSFWKKRLSEDMVWFWELQEYFKSSQHRVENYKALYLWLDKMTQPMYGLTGAFMALANRRRIWRVCEELAHRYFIKLDELSV